MTTPYDLVRFVLEIIKTYNGKSEKNLLIKIRVIFRLHWILLYLVDNNIHRGILLLNNKEEEPIERLPTRQKIHSEIEEALINKLFTVVSNIEELPNGDLNFEPYNDNILIQLETFLEKKFTEKVFNLKEDKQITSFLEQIKRERERRDFGLLFNR